MEYKVSLTCNQILDCKYDQTEITKTSKDTRCGGCWISTGCGHRDQNLLEKLNPEVDTSWLYPLPTPNPSQADARGLTHFDEYNRVLGGDSNEKRGDIGDTLPVLCGLLRKSLS